MADTVAMGSAPRSRRRTDEPCPLCAAAAQPKATRQPNTRFARTADILLPWLLTLGVAVPLAFVFDGPERFFAAGAALGILAAAAFAWQVHQRDRTTALAALARVRSELSAEAEVRVDSVIRQFEWAVNDVASLRDKLERAERANAGHADYMRTAERRIGQLERQLRRVGGERVETAVGPAPIVPGPVVAPSDARAARGDDGAVELRWTLSAEGPLAWIDLGADDPDALPSRVRVFGPDHHVISVSQPAVHGIARGGEARSASLLMAAPPALADALREGETEDYRFEALVAHRWLPVRLTAAPGAVAHRDKRGRAFRAVS